MSEDRELISKAAKAAGYELSWDVSNRICWLRAGGYVDRFNMDYPWSPLWSNGDALRLAARLNIDIVFNVEEQTVQAIVPSPNNPDEGWTFTQDWASDKLSAVRRAIVCAAAALDI